MSLIAFLFFAAFLVERRRRASGDRLFASAMEENARLAELNEGYVRRHGIAEAFKQVDRGVLRNLRSENARLEGRLQELEDAYVQKWLQCECGAMDHESVDHHAASIPEEFLN